MSDDFNGGDDGLSEGAPIERHVLLSWCLCVAGWLACAFMGLWLTIELEAWPRSYGIFFWTVIVILFCNVLLFLSIPFRFAGTDRQLIAAVCGICAAEAAVYGIFYLVARFAIMG